MNTLRCPECGRNTTIAVYVPLLVMLDHTGAVTDVDLTSLDPQDSDEAFCPDCDYMGTLNDFYENSPSQEAAI